MERKAIERIQHTYAPTHFVARLTEENYNVSNVKVIETPFYHEEPDSDTSVFDEHLSGKRYVLYFGRQTQMKGVHRLAEALPKVMSDFPDVHAVFVGNSGKAPSGPGMHEYISELLREYRDRLVILDSMRHDRLYPIVQNAEIVALPSLIDNLPNTCLEAMALSRTVVATSGTCFEQLIAHGESGILVKPDCAEALTEGLQQALRLSTEERISMGERAKSRIADLHPDLKVPELTRYFETLASTGNLSPSVTP